MKAMIFQFAISFNFINPNKTLILLQ